MTAQWEQIARRLRRRVEGVVESEWFSPDERPLGLGRLDFREFRDVSLEELYEAQPVENEYGPCLTIVHREHAPLPPWNPEDVRCTLAQELTLLYGVGPYTAARLRAEGYRSLGDLREHPRWGPQARELLEQIYERDPKSLQGVLRRWPPLPPAMDSALRARPPGARTGLRHRDVGALRAAHCAVGRGPTPSRGP